MDEVRQHEAHPQYLDLDGLRLAVPEGHPDFQLGDECQFCMNDWHWGQETENEIIWIRIDWLLHDSRASALDKRQCASEAFAWWMLKADSKTAGGDLLAISDVDEYDYAMAWATWGGIRKV